MSFSKAKLKRFNEVKVTDSPYADRPGGGGGGGGGVGIGSGTNSNDQRKESIKKLMKELSRDASATTATTTTNTTTTVTTDHHKKTTIISKKSESASDAESIKSDNHQSAAASVMTKTKNCTMRLFRTPSLPKRLRFNRHNTDLSTPKHSNSAKTLFPTSVPISTAAASNNITATPTTITTIHSNTNNNIPATTIINEQHHQRDREALLAANCEIKNKTEVLHEQEQQIEEYKCQVYRLQCENRDVYETIDIKNQKIHEILHELEDNKGHMLALENISKKSIEKIQQLESEIRLILRNHENEIDFLIQTNARLECAHDCLVDEKSMQNIKLINLQNQLKNMNNTTEQTRAQLTKEMTKLTERDEQCKRLTNENLRLLDEIESLRQQTDIDLIAYVEESKNMLNELDQLKFAKDKISNELREKENLIKDLHGELAECSKAIDLDAMRDELRDEYTDQINDLHKKYERELNTLKDLNDIKIKEIESIFVLERSQLMNQHTELVKSLRGQLNRLNETAEEKVRISEIQTEQRIKALESTIEQTIDHEKQMWKCEMDKCQKIAETEIMQCEFEKQDLKSLLDAANELMKEKDDKIDELHTQLTDEVAKFVKCRDEFEAELQESRNECARIMTEKYNYQLTLNNTRSTVTILMNRLQKSDADVEILKNELEIANQEKAEVEQRLMDISTELQQLREVAEDYRAALTALRNSSLALEREMKEKESVFEKLMTSEEETLDTVSKIGKLFNDKVEENIGKYFELYNDIKLKYDARENYILDMKALLDEFATGIELARLELDSKDEQLFNLHQEIKNIKLENMTYKFRCEQFEKYQHQNDEHQNGQPKFCDNDNERKSNIENIGNNHDNDDDDTDDGIISSKMIANIINNLEMESKDLSKNNCSSINTIIDMGLYSDEDKISAENNSLKEKLMEKSKQIEILQEMVKMENAHAAENLELKKKLEEIQENMRFAQESAKKYTETSTASAGKNSNRNKHIDQLKESNLQLKNKIIHLNNINEEQETKICELKEQMVNSGTTTTVMTTPRKALSVSQQNTPKTPVRTPKYSGKENLPVGGGGGGGGGAGGDKLLSPNPNIFRMRNH